MVSIFDIPPTTELGRQLFRAYDRMSWYAYLNTKVYSLSVFRQPRQLG